MEQVVFKTKIMTLINNISRVLIDTENQVISARTVTIVPCKSFVDKKGDVIDSKYLLNTWAIKEEDFNELKELVEEYLEEGIDEIPNDKLWGTKNPDGSYDKGYLLTVSEFTRPNNKGKIPYAGLDITCKITESNGYTNIRISSAQAPTKLGWNGVVATSKTTPVIPDRPAELPVQE